MNPCWVSSSFVQLPERACFESGFRCSRTSRCAADGPWPQLHFPRKSKPLGGGRRRSTGMIVCAAAVTSDRHRPARLPKIAHARKTLFIVPFVIRECDAAGLETEPSVILLWVVAPR